MWRPYLTDWHVVLACVSLAALVQGSIHSVLAVGMLLAGHVAIRVTSESSHHLPAQQEQYVTSRPTKRKSAPLPTALKALSGAGLIVWG